MEKYSRGKILSMENRMNIAVVIFPGVGFYTRKKYVVRWMKFNSCEPQRCFIHLVFLWVNGFRHFCGLFIHFYRAVDVMINEFAVLAVVSSI